MTKLILFTALLTSCAPIGSPACNTLSPPTPIEAPKPQELKTYYDCGVLVGSGEIHWRPKDDPCREIAKEMKLDSAQNSNEGEK